MGSETETLEIMQYFTYSHLPPELQEVSRPFCELAVALAANLPPNSERLWALRKLLESKDSAVRSQLTRK